MSWNLFIVFCILNIVNVVMQTARSIATIKFGKYIASIVNAVAYGLYTVVIVYTVCDLPLYIKVLVVAMANLIGVFVVKLVEEKSRKDKLWKVEATIYTVSTPRVITELKANKIPFNYIENIGKYTIINCYCETQKDSAIVKKILTSANAKFFVSETKAL